MQPSISHIKTESPKGEVANPKSDNEFMEPGPAPDPDVPASNTVVFCPSG